MNRKKRRIMNQDIVVMVTGRVLAKMCQLSRSWLRSSNWSHPTARSSMFAAQCSLEEFAALGWEWLIDQKKQEVPRSRV